MRIYLASTLPALAEALETGWHGAGDSFAVTGALRVAMPDAELEELEYAACTAAAYASLLLLAADPALPARRLVLAADVGDASVDAPPGAAAADEPARVVHPGPVAAADLVSCQVDDPSFATAVAQAMDGEPAEVDLVMDEPLQWYARQELAWLAGTLRD